MKNNDAIIIITLLVLVSMVSCSPQITTQYINKKNDHVMEKLNVDALLNAKEQENASRSVKIDTSYNTKLNAVSSAQYIEVDKASLQRTSITWTLDGGGRKMVYGPGNDLMQFYSFDQDGNLKTRYDKYIGEVVVDANGRYIYPLGFEVVIGKLYTYDTSGNVTKTVDFDELYPFSINELVALLKAKYVSNVNTVSISQRQDAKSQEYYWEVIYKDVKKLHPQLLHIDSKSGEVKEKGDFIVTEQ